ncbi:MAG TPA: DUF1634 domain-containing protein [Gemmatimonadaceae bacterium]|nr:DUF1634 domain-containing protein [Gemmatimonadaceae bacterium]
MEQLIGNLLRYGVLIAAAVVLVGGVLYLAQHGGAHPSYHVFQGEPASLRSLHDIVFGAVTLKSRWVIQLGLILLIATPVARVALSLLAFAVQKDKMYVVVTAIVLGLLVYSLFFGRV